MGVKSLLCQAWLLAVVVMLACVEPSCSSPTLYGDPAPAPVPSSPSREPSTATTTTTIGPEGGEVREPSGAVKDVVTCPGADLQTDPLNCGACGKDCLGAACVVGQCQGTTLATSAGRVLQIAADANNVYWTSDAGDVAYCPLGGCGGVPTVLASNEPYLSGIAVDATTVYWGNQYSVQPLPGVTGAHAGFVSSCSIAGCGGNPARLATSQCVVRSLATAGGSLFWGLAEVIGTAHCTGAINANQSLRCTLGNCAASKVVMGAGLAKIVANDQWTASYTGTQVLKCQHTLPAANGGCGAAPKVVATLNYGAAGLAIDATYVYWVEFGAGMTTYALKRSVLATSAAPTTLWSAPSPTRYSDHDIAVDATEVYWGDGESTGSILKCPLAGCGAGPTTVLTRSVSNPPFQITLTNKAIVWSEVTNNKAIFMVAR